MQQGIEEYSEQHTTPEPDVLSRLTRETHLSQVYPRMLSGHLQGTLLRMISQMVRPTRVLEIGTFTGYSAICLAEGLVDTNETRGMLHTLEVNPELEEIIRKYFTDAALTERIVLHIGDALEILPMLKETWDLVYIDADKPRYLDYYKQVIDRVRPGGILLADNALWGGKVLNPSKADRDTAGIIAFNDYIQQDERVENLLLPVRDGLMMIRKKPVVSRP